MNTDPNHPVVPSQGCHYYIIGLTKRELFAAMAMQGLLANQAFMQGLAAAARKDGQGDDAAITGNLARISTEYVDALIAALNKTK